MLKKVLFIDDDRLISELTSALLSSAGLEVCACRSGEEALISAETFAPDLILLDMQMPNMNGIETLKELRKIKNTRDAPVIFITGSANSKNADKYKEEGAIGVIAKPFDTNTLYSEIASIHEGAATLKDSDDGYLDVIQNKFLLKIRNKLNDIENFSKKIIDETYKQDDLSDIRVFIHQIAGTGKTFGFDEISEHACKIEDELDKLIEGKSLRGLKESLQTNLHNLISISKMLTDKIKEPHYEEIAPSSLANNTYSHTILIADDDILVVELIELYFRNKKIRVISTERGKGATKLAKEIMPDLLILDVNLPDIKGFDVLSNLKKDKSTKHIPVIMLSKMDADKNIIKGISEGAIDYITKPFAIEKLGSLVMSLLNSHGVKILIADDDRLICDLLRIRFQKFGYSLLIAKNGVEALEICKTDKPDLVILDIMMPELDGMAVLGKIKQYYNDLPVVMLTAKSQHDNIMQALEKGAYDYISKPFNADELVAKVNGILKRQNKISN